MRGGATKAEQPRRACHTEIVVNNKGWSCNGARVGNLFQEEVAVFEGQCQPRHIASVAVEILLVCIRCGEHNLERQILAQEFLVLLRRFVTNWMPLREWNAYTYQPRFESIAGRAAHRPHVNADNFICKRLTAAVSK